MKLPAVVLESALIFAHFVLALKLLTSASQFARICCKVFTLTLQFCNSVFSAFDVAKACSNVVPGDATSGVKQGSDLTISGTPSPQGTILVVNTVGVPQAANINVKAKTKVFIRGFLRRGAEVYVVGGAGV